MSALEPAEPNDVERRLADMGIIGPCDWRDYGPHQVTGQLPPDGRWFYYHEDSGWAYVEIYGSERYPFAPAGSRARGGWAAEHLGDEPPVLWQYQLPRDRAAPDDEPERTARFLGRLIDLWRSGTPSPDRGSR